MAGRSEICELAILADWAYMRSHIHIAMTVADGNTMHRAGYALTILRKTAAGRWVVSRDANLLIEKS
jgi:ketosteroid isomerase-like protein